MCEFMFLQSVCFRIFVPLRSDRERGLHERAVRSGVAFPCKVSSITIPLKPEADSESYELVQWPILLPEDFVFWQYFEKMFYYDCSCIFCRLDGAVFV